MLLTARQSEDNSPGLGCPPLPVFPPWEHLGLLMARVHMRHSQHFQISGQISSV